MNCYVITSYSIHYTKLYEIMNAVKNSNLDIGARTLEFNRAEYLIRALGYIENIQDLEESVVAVHNNVPIRIKDVAKVNFGVITSYSIHYTKLYDTWNRKGQRQMKFAFSSPTIRTNRK